MKTYFTSLFVFMSLSISNAQTEFDSSTKFPETLSNDVPASLQTEALMVMEQLGLRTGEVDIPNFGISRRWYVSGKFVGAKTTEFLLMRRATFLDDKNTGKDDPVFDVVAIRDGRAIPFEDVVDIPSNLIVKFKNLDPDFANSPPYYFELTDRTSIIGALKSAYSQVGFQAFRGIVTRGAPPHWDPTPGRIWHVEDATFNLRQEATTEVQDIHSYHFDGDFEAYFSGAQDNITKSGKRGMVVSPWMSGVAEIVH